MYITDTCNRRFLNIDNNLEEVSNMTRKALIIFAAIVAVVLFSFITFAQEQGQETDTESSKKAITYSDLQAQNKTIEGLRKLYVQAKAEYTEECTGKTFSPDDDGLKKCKEKSAQLTTLYGELNKEMESYSKNLARYKANNAQTSPDAIGHSAQGK
jgi:hypothetical protein